MVPRLVVLPCQPSEDRLRLHDLQRLSGRQRHPETVEDVLFPSAVCPFLVQVNLSQARFISRTLEAIHILPPSHPRRLCRRCPMVS